MVLEILFMFIFLNPLLFLLGICIFEAFMKKDCNFTEAVFTYMLSAVVSVCIICCIFDTAGNDDSTQKKSDSIKKPEIQGAIYSIYEKHFIHKQTEDEYKVKLGMYLFNGFYFKNITKEEYEKLELGDIYTEKEK